MDEIMDEIDSVLEENAEEFIKSYVQKAASDLAGPPNGAPGAGGRAALRRLRRTPPRGPAVPVRRHRRPVGGGELLRHRLRGEGGQVHGEEAVAAWSHALRGHPGGRGGAARRRRG